MNIVLVFNGIGNQMSQYAYYVANKNRLRFPFFLFFTNNGNEHNGYELERAFGIHEKNKLISKILRVIYFRVLEPQTFFSRLLGKIFSIIYEPVNYDYTPGLINSKTLFKFYWGGWHSEKNFVDVKDEIKSIFKFNLSYANKECKDVDTIISKTQTSVSLHVRRGDFLKVNPDSIYNFANVATIQYYKSAIAYMIEKFENPTFFVFSDDIQWCKDNLKEGNFVYVMCNTKENSLYDMYLMSKCDHHINANSTFSWWGAWLTETDKTVVICPKEFLKNTETKDIYPARWIKIDSEGCLL